MIKWFRKQDIIATDFVYASTQDLSKINDKFKKYNLDVNTSSVFQRGEYIPKDKVFYTTESQYYKEKDNPVNYIDKSYKRQVYNEVYNMYYNQYNNAYNQFGFDTFDTSLAKLNLADKFIALNFNVYQLGDGIQPYSVKLRNYSGDIIGTIIDDGFNNLYLSGSYFIDKYEYTSSTDNTYNSLGEYGLSGILDSNTYQYIKYNYQNVPVRIELECVGICEGDNIDLEVLINSVHFHFLGGLDGDTFETSDDILEFYIDNIKITGPRSYKKGEIIIVQFTPEFESNPNDYVTVTSGNGCTTTYKYTTNDDGGVLPIIDCRYIYITPITENVRICDSASGGTVELLENWISNNMQFNIEGLIGEDTGIIVGTDTIQHSDWSAGNASNPKKITIELTNPLSGMKFVPSKKNKFTYIPVYNNADLELTNCSSAIPIICRIVDYTQQESCYQIPYRATVTEYNNLINNTVKVSIEGLIDGDDGTVDVTSQWNTNLSAGTQLDLICSNFVGDSSNVHTYSPTYINGCLKVSNPEIRTLNISVADINVCQYARQTPTIEQSNFTYQGLVGNDTGTTTAEIVNFDSSQPLGRTFKVIITGFNPNSANRYIYSLGTLGVSKATLVDCGIMPPVVYVTITVTTDVSTFCPTGTKPIINYSDPVYKDSFNQELSLNLQNAIVARRTSPSYIGKTDTYEYDTVYEITNPVYEFICESYPDTRFVVIYITGTVRTGTKVECGVYDEYEITFTAEDVTVCADEEVTSAMCNYKYSPALHSPEDTISNVTYSIDNETNKILVTSATVTNNSGGSYVYVVKYSNIPGDIIRKQKKIINLTINPVTTIKSGEVICKEDNDETIISDRITTTPQYNAYNPSTNTGLKPNDTITDIVYNYVITDTENGTSIFTEIESYNVNINNEDDCYEYNVTTGTDYIGGIVRTQCETPEPTQISITFTPNNVIACEGATASPNGYTKSENIKQGDIVVDDALQVVGDIISFIGTPRIISADPDSYEYIVSKATGIVTRENCLSITPECPEVCIPTNAEGITTAVVQSMVEDNISTAYGSTLKNSSIKTKDSIKSVKLNINVIEN